MDVPKKRFVNLKKILKISFSNKFEKAKTNLINFVQNMKLKVAILKTILYNTDRTKAKRRVLLLCKADLAEPGKTQQWLSYFKRQGVEAMAYDKSPQKTKQA
ncbi:MAG: hypothetical protein IKC56_02445, partial [Clostridia bacterium]|nr:hypothetical protein [Clostridia bacterium]